MYIRRKIRSRLFLLALIAFGFVYWRGMKAIQKTTNLECEYHVAYAVCKQKGKATELPSLWQVLRAGAKFK